MRGGEMGRMGWDGSFLGNSRLVLYLSGRYFTRNKLPTQCVSCQAETPSYVCRKFEDTHQETSEIRWILSLDVNQGKPKRIFEFRKVFTYSCVSAQKYLGLRTSPTSLKTRKSTRRRLFPFKQSGILRSEACTRVSYVWWLLTGISMPPRSPRVWILEDVEDFRIGILRIVVLFLLLRRFSLDLQPK